MQIFLLRGSNGGEAGNVRGVSNAPPPQTKITEGITSRSPQHFGVDIFEVCGLVNYYLNVKSFHTKGYNGGVRTPVHPKKNERGKGLHAHCISVRKLSQSQQQKIQHLDLSTNNFIRTAWLGVWYKAEVIFNFFLRKVKFQFQWKSIFIDFLITQTS